jgi:hypothetical protein
MILGPKSSIDWDDSERLNAFQISKKYREAMIPFLQDGSLKERITINATRGDEIRTGDWFIGHLMIRNPKTSAIGTDLWYGPYWVHSISGNGSRPYFQMFERFQ